jgi:hypothetical protein
MPIFYEQAIRAGANGDPVNWIQDNHLSEWCGLASALDRLTPEQRCDAIYADWLLQLNSPAALAARQKTASFPETEGETKTDKCDSCYQ